MEERCNESAQWLRTHLKNEFLESKDVDRYLMTALSLLQ